MVNKMVNRFEHFVEEYENISKHIQKKGHDREAARRMLIFTEAMLHAATTHNDTTPEEIVTLRELLSINNLQKSRSNK